ncbi:hypothetical protein BCS42_15745 [Crenothrix sp. D3]|jgi:hypothetical protein|nr:hypothetical protein BCS42_15745 [Crenothrix sp. D3]
MKTLKKITLALCIAASMGAVSTSVMAEGDSGRITYAPADAIDMVANKTGVALNAIEQGEDAAKVDGLIADILAASKEINASDKVFAKRDKVHSKLKAARKDLKEGNRQGAEQNLRNAQKDFLALKEIL